MAWKGFLKESKSYMGYPETRGRCYTCRPLDWDETKRMVSFWVKFPKAWIKFNWYMCRAK